MKTLSLFSSSHTPCGVEAFARRLAAELRARHGTSQRVATMPQGLRELWAARREARATDVLIVNLPLVAWKWLFITPILFLLLGRLDGRKVLVILHDWSALDWRRRFVLAPCLIVATHVLVCAPRVARELRESPLGVLVTGRRTLLAVPPNLSRPGNLPETALAQRLAQARREGRIVLGQFGSIYPKKRNAVALEVAAELRRRDLDVLVVFVGDYIEGRENVEESFRSRACALGLEDRMIVTGYVDDSAELFSALGEVDVFVYSFEQGVESNRASVLACLQAGRPVVVNAPHDPAEFDHHATYREQLAGGRLYLASFGAGAIELADFVLTAKDSAPTGPVVDEARAWADAVATLERTIGLDPDRAQLVAPGAELEKER
jgi:glycosyltransferase involved in cell wall biosynthesis